MFRIALRRIYLTKGDTARFTIEIEGIPGVSDSYTPSTNDKVYFIVTKTPDIVKLTDLSTTTSTKYLFYKQGTNIVINPSDTNSLDYGTYYYQVRLVMGSTSDVNTLIEPEEFIITPREEVVR